MAKDVRREPRPRPGNNMKGRVEIFLDRRRYLRLTFDAMRRFQEAAGTSIKRLMVDLIVLYADDGVDAMERFQKGREILTDERLVLLLWALLLDEDPTLDPDDVPALMEACPEGDGNLDEQEGYIQSKLIDAYMLRRGIDLNSPELKKKRAEAMAKMVEEKRRAVEALESPSTSTPIPGGTSSSGSPAPSSGATTNDSGA